jgi:hypothetical protein
VSHIPPALAQRLDRLAQRAHAFHRFAHHPLCPAYASEVIRVGRRTRLCRGCALAAAGAATGALVAFAAPVPPVSGLAIALALAVPAALAAVRPRTVTPAVVGRGLVPRHGARASKLLTRAVPLALAAGLATLGLRSHSAGGAVIAAAAAAISVAATAVYRRRRPDRSPCLACPERAAPRVCSGLRRIARREAAFARLAGRLIAPPL